MSSNPKIAGGKTVSVVWLRRDLRLYDHRVFEAAAKTGQEVQPVFVFDPGILARFTHKNDRRLTLIAETLCRMHMQLQKKGGGIVVLYGNPEKIIPSLCDVFHADRLFAAEDFEPATRERDAIVATKLGKNTAFSRVRDHLLAHPDDVLKSDGTAFKVFTPYSRVWREKARAQAGFAAQADMKGLQLADYDMQVALLRAQGMAVTDPGKGAKALLTEIGYIWQAHDWPVDAARRRLHAFADTHMDSYKTQRNFMAAHGTSRLSPYLRFGLLSIRECARIAFELEDRGSVGAAVWMNELIWREFYAMILYHFPHTQNQEMQPDTREVKWSYDKEHFAQFTAGKTGYPIVDAAMRELLKTGYMHNRARMIVASFMTKDLQLDWRLGEEHFAQYLMDYELSSNVGGWQWAASTGTDAQPYFRVFNPLLQSQKFDPKGEYIRLFVPELANLPDNDIHEPPLGMRKSVGYPAPIVNHADARKKAIEMFKKVRLE